MENGKSKNIKSIMMDFALYTINFHNNNTIPGCIFESDILAIFIAGITHKK